MQKLEKKVSAVLVAAGSSTRMGFDKLSFDLGGETVVQRSIRAFAECPLVDEIVLVAGKNRAFLEQQAAACPKPVQVVPGGATRAESAKNGVLAAHGDLVAVHDAARPFVSEAVIEAAVYAAAACGAAAPAVPVKDTVKRAVRGDGKTVPEHCMVTDTPDRSTLYAVQTPQCFDRAAYLAALDELDAEKARLVTDDCSLFELTGRPEKINAFLKMFSGYDILELCRTGITALERGGKHPHMQKPPQEVRAAQLPLPGTHCPQDEE